MHAVLLAGGSGVRFNRTGDKLWTSIRGRPLWIHGALALANHPAIEGMVIVVPAKQIGRFSAAAASIPLKHDIVAGGDDRQGSCLNGLRALPATVEWVAVHDAARPNLKRELLDRLLAPCEADAVVPAVPLSDTVKRVHNGRVVETLDRRSLVRVQTPQVVRVTLLRSALEEARTVFTDEASAIESVGGIVAVVEGDPENHKLTAPSDLGALRASMEGTTARVRTGIGYDVHRLVEGRPLILGGVRIPYELGLDGHSDADVLTHAVCDALLGAAGMPDIGRLYPNTDERFRGIDSQRLLADVCERLTGEGWVTENIDCTVVAEAPRLADRVVEMRERLAETMRVDPSTVNVKATTNEGLGALGAGLGIAAYAVATIRANREE